MSNQDHTSIDVSRNKVLFAEVLGISNPTLGSFMFLVLFFVTLGWMGDTLFGGLMTLAGPTQFQGWPLLLTGVLPFVVVSGWGWWRWLHARKERLKIRAQSDNVEPHAGVILFLSKIVNESHLKKLSVRDRTVLDEARFSWKPCQRGLEKHREKLDTVWVICSPESLEQFSLFRDLFQPLFPDVRFEYCGGDLGVSFEDLEGLVDCLENIYANLPKEMDASDVIIDITGGQKPASVAGMMVSMIGDGREVQYVQTNSPHDIKTYAYEILPVGRRIKERK